MHCPNSIKEESGARNVLITQNPPVQSRAQIRRGANLMYFYRLSLSNQSILKTFSSTRLLSF